MKKDTIVVLISAALVLLFLYASVSKIVDPELFQKQMLNQPLPLWLSRINMFLVPGSEILISIFLMFDKTRTKALIASSVLMALFTGYVAFILLRAFKWVPCSCGGVIQHFSWKQHLVFNIIFLGLALTGVILSRQMGKREKKPSKLSYIH